MSVCRDAGVDARYIQVDHLPPQPRLSVSGGRRSGSGGAGSSLMASGRCSGDFIQGISTNLPLSQSPADVPSHDAEVPLKSSYFPAKS